MTTIETDRLVISRTYVQFSSMWGCFRKKHAPKMVLNLLHSERERRERERERDGTTHTHLPANQTGPERKKTTCILYVCVYEKHTCVYGQGHTLLHLAGPHCKCRESHLRMPPADVGASESWTDTHGSWHVTAPSVTLFSALRGQGADVLETEHVEPHCCKGPVLMHHVRHLGGQVGAGCCEHFAYVCWPCRRLLLLTDGEQDC